MSESLTSPQAQLNDALSSMNYWARKASNYEAVAADMRRVAKGLEQEVGALHNLFMPIRHLHTAATWEGNAATLSRQRLDAHESRLNGATLSINAIIADLETGASTNSSRAQTARGSSQYYRRQAADLEFAIERENDSGNIYS